MAEIGNMQVIGVIHGLAELSEWYSPDRRNVSAAGCSEWLMCLSADISLHAHPQ